MLRRGTDRGEDRGRLGVDKDCLWSTLGGLWVVEMPRCPGCQGKSTATSRRSPPRAVSQCTEGIARISDRGRKCNPRAPSLCSFPLFLNLKLDGTIHLVTHRHFATGLSEGHVHGAEYLVLRTRVLIVQDIRKRTLEREKSVTHPTQLSSHSEPSSWLQVLGPFRFRFFVVFLCVASFSVSKRAYLGD